MSEGVIKIRLRWQRAGAPRAFVELVRWRERLHRAGLIGAQPNGIGYGNLSVRRGRGFVISGSGTGALRAVDARHFTRVLDYDLRANVLTCRGPIAASSESLTHAAVYEADPTATAVVHVHQRSIGCRLLCAGAPATAPNVAYGTPAMAAEVLRLFEETAVSATRLFVMAGHEDGIVSFGGCPADAAERLLRLA